MVIDLIFPRVCYGCGRIGEYLCPVCRRLLVPLPLRPSSRPPLEGRLSLFKYHHPLRPALADLKFNFVSDLVSSLSTLAADTIKSGFPHLLDYWHQNHFFLVPLPLHPHRQLWRGFNQSLLLGQSIATQISLPVISELLVKNRSTPAQTSLSLRSRRYRNPVSAFSLNPDFSSPLPANVILFDDVYTTGSTLRSAASCLPSLSSLWFLTIAG